MFVNGLEIGSDGRIVTSQGAVAPGDGQSGAFSYDPLTRGVRADVLVPQYYANGFGFNGGKLCIGPGPVAYFQGGLPFNALGQLMADGVAGTLIYNRGWPLSPSGIGIQPIVPPETPVTWNPADINANEQLSNGNLTITNFTAGGGSGRATLSHSTTGKYYFECRIDFVVSHAPEIGVAPASMALSTNVISGGWAWQTDNNVTWDHGTTSATNANYTTGDIIAVAIDFAAGKIWWGKNNVWINSGNPATGVNPQWSNIAGALFPCMHGSGVGSACTGRFILSAFTYTPPAGFSSWGSA